MIKRRSECAETEHNSKYRSFVFGKLSVDSYVETREQCTIISRRRGVSTHQSSSSSESAESANNWPEERSPSDTRTSPWYQTAFPFPLLIELTMISRKSLIMSRIDRMWFHSLPRIPSSRMLFYLVLYLSSLFNQQVLSESEALSPRSVNTKYGALRGTIVYFKGYDRGSTSSSTSSSSLGSKGSSTASGSTAGGPSSANNQKNNNNQYGPSLRPVEVFLGIPYATAPVGSLRFMPPVTPTHWRGVRLANRFGPVCPQRLPDMNIKGSTSGRGNQDRRSSSSSKGTFPYGPNASQASSSGQMPESRLGHLNRMFPFLKNQSEDCLYLNIYAPFSPQQSKS